ncbi:MULTISPECIES: hypothetical protein [unclassified Aureimonas]|nr:MULTISPECIES: hypothetical protein [unclassified Aureimonas]
MSPFIDLDHDSADRLAAAAGILTGLAISITLWLALLNAWLLIR